MNNEIALWLLSHSEPIAWIGGGLVFLMLAVVFVRLHRLLQMVRVHQRHFIEHFETLFDAHRRSAVEANAVAEKHFVDLVEKQARTSAELYQKLLREFAALQQLFIEKQADLTAQQSRSDSMLREQLLERFDTLRSSVTAALTEGSERQSQAVVALTESLNERLASAAEHAERRQAEGLKTQQDSLVSGFRSLGEQVGQALKRNSEDVARQVVSLTDTTDKRLKEISGQVDNRLTEGFRKTTETFNNVLVHLTRIDEAQRKITELSSNVVSLQEVLADKRSRGAFGEVQLNALVRNVMPEKAFSLQHVFSNGKRADCVLFLPEPTGHIAIDSKFPLESFQVLTNFESGDVEREAARRRFRQDIKKHIRDIADKYIIPGETSDGAMMFVPAEAVFAEIHASFPDLVEEAYRRRVWLVSPTTMMAILTTARAVLKDAETRKQIHVIQKHLGDLKLDFERFDKRMDNLAKHIRQANDDVGQIKTSASKISKRFVEIETVEIEQDDKEPLPVFKSDKLKLIDGE